MTDPTDKATAVAQRLRAVGHVEASDRIGAAALGPANGMLEALREACQSVLTAIEAIDPASYAAIEELRLDVDRRLATGRTSG